MAIDLTKLQRDVLTAEGHVLVTGGPGSGKTTVSILKAGRLIREELKYFQSVLFLSFARATVSRVLEAIDEETELTSDARRRIDVDTYHAFFWRLIKTHGYLLGLPRRINVLTPQSEAVALSSIRSQYAGEGALNTQEREEKKRRESNERLRVATECGLVCFDLFAELASQLLHGSSKVRNLVSNAYPVIVLDEFQDTGPNQWRVIQALGRESRLIALADPEQRIFDFIGADPARLDQFESAFPITKFDLRNENHRSGGMDLNHFGNDVLRGEFSKKTYEGVAFSLFDSNQNQAITKVITATLGARKRLVSSGPKNWSLAVLVPTKRMTRLVSDAFREPLGKLPRIEHHAAIDMEAAILAAEVIALSLQCQGNDSELGEFVDLICAYYQGKGGGTPSKTNLDAADAIRRAFERATTHLRVGKNIPKRSLYLPIRTTFMVTFPHGLVQFLC